LLEFAHVDDVSSISIDDAESSFRGSYVKGMQLPGTTRLAFTSQSSRLDLTGTTLVCCKLNGVGLSQCQISGTKFIECDLKGALIVELKDSVFQDCDLSSGCRISKGSDLAFAGSKTNFEELKLSDAELQGYSFDGIPKEQILKLNLNGKHLVGGKLKGEVPSLVLSGTCFDSFVFELRNTSEWSLCAREAIDGPPEHSSLGRDESVVLAGDTRVVSDLNLAEALFKGCIFETSSVWTEAKWGNLCLEDCAFGKGSVGVNFPWGDVRHIYSCVFSGSEIKGSSISADITGTRLSGCTLKNVQVLGPGNRIELSIADGSSIRNLDLNSLEFLKLHIASSIKCSELHIAGVAHLESLDILDTPIDDLVVTGTFNESSSGQPSTGRIALLGTTGSLQVRNLTLSGLKGTRLDVQQASMEGLVLTDANISMESVFRNVQAPYSRLSACNLLDVPAVNLSGSSIKGSTVTEGKFNCSFLDLSLNGVDISGCTFNNCDFTGAVLRAKDSRINLESCQFDERCSMSGMEIQEAILDGCLLKCNMDHTIFIGCSFKGAQFPSAEGKAFTGIRFEDCEFDAKTEFRNCKVVSDDTAVFCRSPQNKDSQWHPHFENVEFEKALVSGLDFSESSGTAVFNRCRVENCLLGDGFAKVVFQGGFINNSRFITKTLKELKAIAAGVKKVEIDDLSRSGRFVFEACSGMDLEFADRRFSGSLELTLCAISHLGFTRLPPDPSTAELSGRGKVKFGYCRLVPSDRDDPQTITDCLVLRGYENAASEKSISMHGHLFGDNTALVVRNAEAVLGLDEVTIEEHPDSHWASYVKSQLPPELQGGLSRDILRTVTEQVLLRLPRHFNLVWQGKDNADGILNDLADLRAKIASAGVPPGVFAPNQDGALTARDSSSQKIYDDTREQLNQRIMEREKVARGGFGDDPNYRELVTDPKHYQDPLLKLISLISLSVGHTIAEESWPEPKHLVVFLFEIAKEASFKVVPPLPIECPVESDTARIFLDTDFFRRIIQFKVLQNIDVHLKSQECSISIDTEKINGEELIIISIADKGRGWEKSVTDILEKHLKADSFRELREFSSRFCNSMTLVTTCADQVRRAFTIGLGELSFHLDEKAELDQSERGTAFVFKMQIFSPV
jgi:uncharacterized protein YjbI with pentapeptide repeats